MTRDKNEKKEIPMMKTMDELLKVLLWILEYDQRT
jgi:hypothetical protein